MNERQKIVQEQFLHNEEVVLKRLKRVYDQSLKDLNEMVDGLQKDIDEIVALKAVTDDPAELERLASMERSKIYQKSHQESLKKQVANILDTMQSEQFVLVDDYLRTCYEDGFIGTMFDLQGQGIPMAFPLDQEAMIRAVQLDSKISVGLYTRLGENVDLLKRRILAEVSRGISSGMSYADVATQLKNKTNIGFNNAMRIARTEGHRVQIQSGMEACYKAKDIGADVVKQWDAALDKRTRRSHREVDGEIRELDEPFSNGLMFPGDPDGRASEVINCRCALLQRARLALDEDELETLKERASYFGLDKTENFKEYKKKYLKASDTIQNEIALKEAVTPSPKRSKMLSQEEIVAEAKNMGAELMANPSLMRYDNGYPITDYINRQIGYDELPTVLSGKDFDKAAKGKTVLFRGVADDGNMTAKEMSEQFKHGNFYAGRGIYGYGTYTDTRREVAQYYSLSEDTGEEGVIMEMMLADDAKIVDYVDIFTEYEKTGIPKIIGDKPEAWQDVIDNVGSYASLKGYDAIALNGYQNKSHIVILNRGKVIIKE